MDLVSVAGHGILLFEDGGDGFKGYSKMNGFTIGDPSLNASAPIGFSSDLIARSVEGVIML